MWTFAVLVTLASTFPCHVTQAYPISHGTPFSGHGGVPRISMRLSQANQSLSKELGISPMKLGEMNACSLSLLGPGDAWGLDCWQQGLCWIDKDCLWSGLLMEREREGGKEKEESRFFFLRKISPELTTASPPRFLLRKPGPELTSLPIFLYFICGMPDTAWRDKQCHVRTRDRTSEPRAAEKQNVRTAAPPGWPQERSLDNLIWIPGPSWVWSQIQPVLPG